MPFMAAPMKTSRWLPVLVTMIAVLAIMWWQQERESQRLSGEHTAGPGTPSVSPSTGPGSAGLSCLSGLGGRQTGVDSATGLHWVRLESLPGQARTTLALICAGGPFPYDRDGVVFHNFDDLLPSRREGYYHEYTVRTPGRSDRGPRRIVSGAPGEYFWTQDHYDSFERIAP